jgi:hypothetical protein
MRNRIEYAALAIALLGILGTLAASWVNLSERVAVVETKSTNIENKVDGLRDMLVEAIKSKSMSRR